MEKRINYKEAGVTLVALVITIIVLTILAGITISSALGSNGILNTAQRAGQAYEQGERGDTDAIQSYSDVYSRATSNKYRIIVDGYDQNLVTFFKDTKHALLSSDENDIILLLRCINGYAEIRGVSASDVIDKVIGSDELHHTNIDNAIQVKKHDRNVNVDTDIDSMDDNTYIRHCGFGNYSAIDYFLSEMETSRPHLYINGEDIGLEEWNYNYNESEDRYELKNSRGSYLYSTDYNNGTLYYNKSGNPITINIKINVPDDPNEDPSLELSGFNASALTEFAIKYDDGRTYDSNTKEFMYVIWDLLGDIAPRECK